MLRRLTERLPPGRGERTALAALLAVLAAGAALRLWLMLAMRPALVGYADSYPYIGSAHGALFGDPLRPAGYPLFLRVVHWMNANLSFTTLVQHGLGLASALLLYVAARRFGVPRWWALLPAGAIALGGPQILIEHAPLTEAVFVFLQSAIVYLVARAAGERDWAWAAAAGVVAGIAVTVRTLGLLLLAAAALAVVVTPADGWRRRVARASTALAAGAVIVGAYVVVHEQETGYTGLTRAGGWNLYGRVAPFADCDEFDPPAGTRTLCEARPPDDRPGPNSYIFDGAESPAVREFGNLFETTQAENDKVESFARAALRAQPLDWLDHVVTEDLVRYVSSEHLTRAAGQGLTFDGLQETLVSGPVGGQTMTLVSTYYSTSGQYLHQGRFDAITSYERATRPVGVLFVALALLALLGLALARGRLRAGALVFTAVALVSIVGPPLTLFYDARYAIPAFGPLAAAAAVGGAALMARVAAARERVASGARERPT